MNYRHIYHAGNFADVVKHAALTRLIEYLKRKDKAFRVIDTHAGAGLYDLGSDAAQRTGEWLGGIGKVVLLQRPLDVDRMGVVALDEIGVIAVHRPDEIRQGRGYSGGQAAAETRRGRRELDREVVQCRPVWGRFRKDERLHRGGRLAAVVGG